MILTNGLYILSVVSAALSAVNLLLYAVLLGRVDAHRDVLLHLMSGGLNDAGSTEERV
jgi:hypothetical protein